MPSFRIFEVSTSGLVTQLTLVNADNLSRAQDRATVAGEELDLKLYALPDDCNPTNLLELVADLVRIKSEEFKAQPKAVQEYGYVRYFNNVNLTLSMSFDDFSLLRDRVFGNNVTVSDSLRSWNHIRHAEVAVVRDLLGRLFHQAQQEIKHEN